MSRRYKERYNSPEEGGTVKKKKKKSIGKRIFLTILIIIAMIAGVIFGMGYQKFSLLDFVKIDKNNIGIDLRVKVDLSKYRNVLLLGTDSQTNDYDDGRSDVIMIASINKETKEVNLISVYRDTYVDVEENGNTVLDKVNHAYAYGGAANTIKSLNKAMDLNISEFAAVDFKAVADTVDAVGGIELDITDEELKYINNYINDVAKTMNRTGKKITSSGLQTVDGIQATAYCRIRYTSGYDYKRAERQRTVLQNILAKAKTLSVFELNTLANKLLPEISTNISSTEILGLATDITKYNIKKQYGWPYKTKGYKSPTFYGVPCSLETNVQRLHEELFGQKNYEVSQTVKDMSQKIINETGYTADEEDADKYEDWNV